MNFNPNSFHSDLWSVSFSNIPSLSGVSDLKYFDNFVKGMTIPDYTMEEIFSEFQGFRIRHPVAPKLNTNLNKLTIEFKLSEDMKNYWTTFQWMQSMKYADIHTNDFFRKYTIKSINLNLMDNQKRTIANVRFTEAFLLNLGSLGLTTGSSEELTFGCEFSYEEIFYETLSVFN